MNLNLWSPAVICWLFVVRKLVMSLSLLPCLWNTGLSSSAGCWWNSPAESEVIAGWILDGNCSVWKGKGMILRWITCYHLIYRTYCWTEKIWIIFFLTTWSLGSTMRSTPIQIKYCFKLLFTIPSFCFSLHHNFVFMRLGSPSFEALLKIGNKMS